MKVTISNRVVIKTKKMMVCLDQFGNVDGVGFSGQWESNAVFFFDYLDELEKEAGMKGLAIEIRFYLFLWKINIPLVD